MRYVYIFIHTSTHKDYGNVEFDFKNHSDVLSSYTKAIHEMEWRHNYDIEDGQEVTDIQYAENPSLYYTAELCSFTSTDKYGFTTRHQLFRSPLYNYTINFGGRG